MERNLEKTLGEKIGLRGDEWSNKHMTGSVCNVFFSCDMFTYFSLFYFFVVVVHFRSSFYAAVSGE